MRSPRTAAPPIYVRRPNARRSRATEKKRFDAMARAVRADTDLTKADAAKRLARIETLRALVG